MTSQRKCPVCRVSADKIQLCGPSDKWPSIVYPCQCWLTPAEARKVARS